MPLLVWILCSLAQIPNETVAEDAIEAETVQRITATAIGNLEKLTPFMLEYFFHDIEDVKAPEVEHPTFHGAFDWHSSVHNHWLLVRCLKLHPDLFDAKTTREFLDHRFAPEKLKAEADFFGEFMNTAFEFPYGWAWLLALAAELRTWHDDPDATRWAEAMLPLEQRLVTLFKNALERRIGPDRTGMRFNTAFSLSLALDYARAVGDTELESLIITKARLWYFDDVDYPVHYEPFSPEAFLSPAYCEADLMRRFLPPKEFGEWLTAFLPGLDSEMDLPLFTPPKDIGGRPNIFGHHLGLAMSRAWTLEGVASGLPEGDPRVDRLLRLATELRQSVSNRLAEGNFAHDHWLPSFAIYLLTDKGLESRD